MNEGLRAPQPQSSDNSEAGILIDLYEASEHNGPVLHYYVVVVNNAIAGGKDPNDFDIEDVIILLLFEYFQYQTRNSLTRSI